MKENTPSLWHNKKYNWTLKSRSWTQGNQSMIFVICNFKRTNAVGSGNVLP